MRRRVYWMLPDLPSARATMDDLLKAGIELRHMHFVGREDGDMSGLHAANVLQTSDVIGSAEAGLVIGAAVGGLLGAACAVIFPGEDGTPQWMLLPLLVVIGALFDGWVSSMIGISVPSRRLQRFASAIAQGRLLLMLDLPVARVADIEARLQAMHPEAHPEGGETGMPLLG